MIRSKISWTWRAWSTCQPRSVRAGDSTDSTVFIGSTISAFMGSGQSSRFVASGNIVGAWDGAENGRVSPQSQDSVGTGGAQMRMCQSQQLRFPGFGARVDPV